MIVIAMFLELGMGVTFMGSSDPRTRALGVVLWCAYLYWSALWSFLRGLIKALWDMNNPPGV